MTRRRRDDAGRYLLICAARPRSARPRHAAPAADCDVTVGVVMELTGPAGEYGQAGAKSVEMAFRDLNDAGGVASAASSSPTRAIRRARATSPSTSPPSSSRSRMCRSIIGGIISSVSIPILTSVTAPAKVVQVSPASSSPTLTALGREGKTNGVFFRTITSDALQGTAAAKYALDQGLKKIAIIHVNNDFGVNMVTEFSKAYKALGGEIVSATPYNEKQSSYQAEVTAAMAGKPDGALSGQLSGRRRHHRARLDLPGRAGEVPAQ